MRPVLFVVLVIACAPASDLNSRCSLVKRNLDGGAPVPVREAEVRNLQGQNKDFIALGSIDCEDLICVRDSFFATDAAADAPASGYCSRQCVPGAECPSSDRGANALHCRALLLSAESLRDLSAGDGGFPGVRDPHFCARGSPDGGA